MVLQTKLVNTTNLIDLSKQLLEVRKDKVPNDVEKNFKDVIKSVDEGSEDKNKACFKSLFVGLLTHLIENEDVELEVLEELIQCYEKSNQEKADDEPLWADVLTDLILSLLPTASANVMKQLVLGFKSITSTITQDSINVVVDNLCRTGVREDDEEEDIDEGGDDDDNDEEIENEDDESEDDEDDDDKDDDEEDEEEEPTEIEKFRAKLSSILGPDVEDDDEHGADDEEMLKLDEALSEAFKEKLGSSKKERIKELKLSDDFKCRVLTFYDTILKRRQIPATFVIPVIPIIINLSKKNSSLGEKCVSVLGDISTIPVARICIEGLDLDFTGILNRIVSESFEICCNPKSEKRQQIMAQIIIWTSKLAKSHNWSIPEFAEGLVTFFKKSISKSHKFSHSFFEGLVERDEAVATLLQEPIIESIFDDEIKVVNRAPACQVLNLALKRGQPIKDPKDLLQKCSDDVVKMLGPDGKQNVLILAGLLGIIDTLKSHKHYGLEVPKDLIESLKTLSKKTKLKMPKPGQNAVRSLLKGTQESNGMKVKNGENKGNKIKVKSDGAKKRKEAPMSKGVGEKLKKKKKLVKK